MKALITFFGELTINKKILLMTAPLLTLILSMKFILLGLWLLICIDLLTGIRKSLHENGVGFKPFKKVFWGSIKSYLLRRTWKKTYEYGMGIVVIAVIESLILGATPITMFTKTFTITQLSAVIPALVEMWSIFENLEAVSGNNILKKLRPFMPKIIRVILGEKSTRGNEKI